MSEYFFRTRVSYDDIDQDRNLTLRGAMGHMQEAAILHSSQSGYSIEDVSRTHVIWMLVQWRAKLVGKVKWNRDLTVCTWPRTMERLTSIRNYEVFGGDGALAAIGESNWVLVNADSGRPARITPEIAAAYHLTERDVFSAPLPPLSKGEGTLTAQLTVSYRDLDTNCHVNNRVYLDYAREALPAEWITYPFTEVSVRYHKQLLLGNPVNCWYRNEDACHIVEICGEDRTKLHATVVFYA